LNAGWSISYDLADFSFRRSDARFDGITRLSAQFGTDTTTDKVKLKISDLPSPDLNIFGHCLGNYKLFASHSRFFETHKIPSHSSLLFFNANRHQYFSVSDEAFRSDFAENGHSFESMLPSLLPQSTLRESYSVHRDACINPLTGEPTTGSVFSQTCQHFTLDPEKICRECQVLSSLITISH
jgi:hypothetical protein